MFNIDAMAAAAETPRRVVVAQEQGNPEQTVGFLVLGAGSEAYRQAQREVQILNIREAAQRKTVTLDMTTEEGAEIAVQNSESRRDLVIQRCVVGWFGFTLGDGSEAPFTQENLQRVLQLRPHWKLAILASVEEEVNFSLG